MLMLLVLVLALMTHIRLMVLGYKCAQEYKLYQNKLKSKSNHTQKMIIKIKVMKYVKYNGGRALV
jgi:hypothetical protein